MADQSDGTAWIEPADGTSSTEFGDAAATPSVLVDGGVPIPMPTPTPQAPYVDDSNTAVGGIPSRTKGGFGIPIPPDTRNQGGISLKASECQELLSCHLCCCLSGIIDDVSYPVLRICLDHLVSSTYLFRAFSRWYSIALTPYISLSSNPIYHSQFRHPSKSDSPAPAGWWSASSPSSSSAWPSNGGTSG